MTTDDKELDKKEIDVDKDDDDKDPKETRGNEEDSPIQFKKKLSKTRTEEILNKWKPTFSELTESYEIDLEKYKKNKDIIAVYSTKKEGGVEAFVIQKSGKGFRYSGKLGAGSTGFDDIKRTVNVTRSSKKGVTLVYGTDVNDYKV